LYKWKAASATTEKPAVLLAAHYDVVPVPNEDLSKWKHAPFSGHIGEDFIWGRGALDDKVGVVSIMEAIENLLKQGYEPKERSIYIAIGADEEIGGEKGAAEITKLLKERQVKLEVCCFLFMIYVTIFTTF